MLVSAGQVDLVETVNGTCEAVNFYLCLCLFLSFSACLHFMRKKPSVSRHHGADAEV
jgi:hypothetical protein